MVTNGATAVARVMTTRSARLTNADKPSEQLGRYALTARPTDHHWSNASFHHDAG